MKKCWLRMRRYCIRNINSCMYNWGERSEAPHGRYISDFPYMIYVLYMYYYYRRTSDRSNFALAAHCAYTYCACLSLCKIETRPMHKACKRRVSDKARRAPSLVFLCVLDGVVLSIELTRLQGYYWLSGKLIGSLR